MYQILDTIIKNSGSGSYLLRGTRDQTVKYIINNSDTQELLINVYNSLGIDDVRKIITAANNKAEIGRLVIISFYSATLEAQNALLKFLEEPAKTTKIILITTNSSDIIKTVLSRTHKYSIQADEKDLKDINTFLKTDPTARINLAFIKKMLAAKQDNSESVDKEPIDMFISSLLIEYSKSINVELSLSEQKTINNCLELGARMQQKSASAKNILEYVSLALKAR